MTLAIARCNLRLLFLLVHLSAGIIISLGMRMTSGKTWHSSQRGEKIIRWWMRYLSLTLGLRITCQGEKLGQQQALFLSNHISWLDIIAISSVMDVKFISKDTVRLWPVVGFLAASSGTIFIKRGKMKEISEASRTIANTLIGGSSVVIFPEGTTTDGRYVKLFHSALIQPAIDAQVSVQAIALRYLRQGKIDTLAPYIKKDIFIIHMLRVLCAKRTHAVLTFLPAVDTSHLDRQTVALLSRKMIQAQLREPV